MGWSIVLESDKVIREEEVDQIIKDLPSKYQFAKGELGIPPKQTWGWSTAVDVFKPKGKTMRCTGSYGMSGRIAEEFCSYLAAKLETNGHSITKEILI